MNNYINNLYSQLSNGINQKVGYMQNQMQNQFQQIQQPNYLQNGNNSPIDLNRIGEYIKYQQNNGVTAEQLYQQLMQNPNVAQALIRAKQQYPNMSFTEMANKNGYNVTKLF